MKEQYKCGKKQNVRKKGESVDYGSVLDTVLESADKPYDFEKKSINIREIHMKRNEGWSLIVPMKVNGVSCQAVIDTAAQVTVISDRIFHKMKFQPKIQENVILKDATALNNIPAQLVNSVRFTLGNCNYKWNSYVASLADEVILGLDFLKENRGIVNLVDNQLVLNDEIIPAILKTNSHGNLQKLSRVITKKKIVIPPHTMRMTQGHLNEKLEGLYSFSPIKSDHFCSPHALVRVTDNDRIPVNLWNQSDKFFTVRAGSVIGSCTEAEVIESGVATQNCLIRSMQTTSEDLVEGEKGRGECENKGKSELRKRLPAHVQEMFEKSVTFLSENQARKFADLLIEMKDVFATSDTDLGCFTAIKHTIDTGEATPVKQQMRRTPLGFQAEEEKHLKSMLDCGVITPSISEWSSAPVLVRKKDGSIRWCIDYRAVNEKCSKQVWPIPSFSQCSELFSNIRYLSTVDLNSGYWQIEMDEKDRHKTAFITKYGLYEYKRMPFGLTNAPATFMRAMTLVLQGLQWKDIIFYLDDVCILGKDFDHHLSKIRDTLLRFRQYNLKLKPRKCIFFQQELTFLGRLVGRNGVNMTKEAVEKVMNWPKPTRVKDVESFLGFANYYRDHIKEFAKHTSILYTLTGSKANFEWTEEHDTAFKQVKSMLTEAPVLVFPNNEDLFILDTDASDIAVGGVLSQVQEGVEKVVSYGSFVLTPQQRRYCTTRKELLAVVRFTRQFCHYLLGRKFILRTDHSSLTWLMNFKNIGGQLARWIEEISQYDMSILHRAGKLHGNADGLSRIPDQIKYCDSYNAGINPEQLPCGGCQFCVRAHSQWSRFEEDVDNVIPLSVRSLKTSAENIQGYTSEQMRELQKNDPDIQQLITWKEGNIEPKDNEMMLQSRAVKHFWLNKDLLVLKDGVLFYMWKQQDTPLLMVPKDLKIKVLEGCHDCILAGHVGVTNTKEKLRRSYIWYGVTSDVKRYVKSCVICSRNKKANRKAKGHLNSFHSGYPMERIHMDILGPFPKSNKGNQYILMVIDQFTKWLEAFPIPNQSAETVADTVVKEYFSRFGIPLNIHTDQGKNFDGSIMESVCQRLGITKTRTTPYHPSSNGQIERYNRTLLQMIRCFLEKEQEWDKNLPLLTSAIRGITNRQTGCSANKLMLGREIMLPIDFTLGITKKDSVETDAFADKLEQDFITVYQLARKNIQSFQMRQKRDYDLKLVEHQYKVGDFVYEIASATKVGQSSKLKKMWKGPFVVTKVLSPVLYQIKAKKDTRVVHHDRLKICLDRDIPHWLVHQRDPLIQGTRSTDSIPTNVNNAHQALKEDKEELNSQKDNIFDEDNDVQMDMTNEEDNLDESSLDGIQNLFEDKHQEKTTSRGRRIKTPAYLSDFDI